MSILEVTIKIHWDAQESDKKEAFDVSLDGVFEGAFISAIEDPTEGFSGDTPKDVP